MIWLVVSEGLAFGVLRGPNIGRTGVDRNVPREGLEGDEACESVAEGTWAGWKAWFAWEGTLSAGLMMGSPDFDICDTIALTNADEGDDEGGDTLCEPLGTGGAEFDGGGGGTERFGLEADGDETGGGRWEGDGDRRTGGAGGWKGFEGGGRKDRGV